MTDHAEREAREMSLDDRIAAEDRQCGTNCGACLNQCGDMPDGMPFLAAVVRRDLWLALRFAATDQAIAQLDAQAARLNIPPCGGTETVTDFHLRIVDASLDAYRAAVLASARERVEALLGDGFTLNPDADGEDELVREGFCNGLAAAARAITEAT